MAANVKTELGNLYIENEVIAKVSGLAAMECYGVVGMAANNIKEGFVQLLMGENLSKGIKVSDEEDGVVIELHIIVEYGTNISTIADNLISTVTYRVQDMLGLKVSSVNVYVEGIRTPEQED